MLDISSTSESKSGTPTAFVPTSTPPSLATKLFYGAGSMAFGIKDQGFGVLLMLFYNQVLGLPARQVGLAVMIALMVDALLDPTIGYLSDNLRSRWGRRHPFMYAAALPIAGTYLLLWNPPAGLSHGQLFAYLTGVSILVRACITCFEIPSSAQVAELTASYDQRTDMLSYRYFFGWVTSLTMSILAFSVILKPDATHKVGQLNPEGYSHYSWIAAGLMLAAILVSAIGTHRNIKTYATAPARPRMTARQIAHEIITTLSERAFLVMAAAGVFGATAAGLGGALIIYFRTYFFDLTGNQISILLSANFISVAVAVFVAPRLSKRFGKKRVSIAASVASILIGPIPVVLRLLHLGPENGSTAILPLLFCFTTVTAGLGIVSNILMSSMIADVVEHSQLKTGRRNEGLFFSANAFILKCVSGIGLFFGGLLLDIVGFPQGAHPGPETHAALSKLATLEIPLTVALYLVGVACVVAYPISRSLHQANLSRLEAAQ